MECSTHPEKASVGYCKKCGKLGCADCMIKVAMTGQVGKQLDAAEVLLCRECLAKARPDLALSGSDATPVLKSGHLGFQKVAKIPKKYAATPPEVARPARSGVRVGKTLAIGLALAAIVVAIAAAAIFFPRSDSSLQPETIPLEDVAALALGALSDGDIEGFISQVDVAEFMCRMDDTGLTRRDYAEADREKWRELVIFHAEVLEETLLVPANMQREYVPLSLEIGDSTASIRIRPWIAYGKRSYRRILLEKKMGQWRISGLASPDF